MKLPAVLHISAQSSSKLHAPSARARRLFQTVRHRLEANVVTIGHDLYVVIGLMSHNNNLLVFNYTYGNKHA
jgi:hypothetical protein